MLLKIEIDDKTANRLAETAAHELRPVHWQAEVILMRALGTWRSPEELNFTSNDNGPKGPQSPLQQS